MSESVLNGKTILLVDDELDVLQVLQDEIEASCPNSHIDQATTYEDALKLLQSNDYDVVVLDIMGVRGFDLLEFAVKKNLRVAMLTGHALNLEALKRARDMKARAYLPKEQLGEIVPFLEDILVYDLKPGWERLLDKLGAYFDKTFGETGWHGL